MSKTQAKRRLSTFDTNDDGKLSKEELRKNFYEGGKSYKALFESVDVDGSGYLDRAEMSAFFKLLGKQTGEVRKLYRDVDDNGDGKISFSEFTAWMKNEYICAQNPVLGKMGPERVQKEMTKQAANKASHHASIRSQQTAIQKIEAEMAVLRQERQIVVGNLSSRRKEAAKIKQMMMDIDNQMNITKKRLRSTRPNGRHMSAIAASTSLPRIGTSQSHSRTAANRSQRQRATTSVPSLTTSRSFGKHGSFIPLKGLKRGGAPPV